MSSSSGGFMMLAGSVFLGYEAVRLLKGSGSKAIGYAPSSVVPATSPGIITSDRGTVPSPVGPGVITSDRTPTNQPDSSGWVQEVIARAKRDGVDPLWALALIFSESSAIPTAHNFRLPGTNGPRDPGENSYGIFQLNLNVHPLTASQAIDPIQSLDYYWQHIVQTYRTRGNMDWASWVQYTQSSDRPSQQQQDSAFSWAKRVLGL